MQTRETQSSGFQPQAISKANPFAPRPFEVTFPGQELAASPTNPFPRRSHEVWIGEPVAASNPATNPEVQTEPELKAERSGWLQFSLHAPDQPPPDSPTLNGIQAKLTIGQPNDPYEQEADRVAEQVMSMATPSTPDVQRQMEDDEIQTKPLAETITPLVQRQGISEEEPLQSKCAACEQEDTQVVQRQPQVHSAIAQSVSHDPLTTKVQRGGGEGSLASAVGSLLKDGTGAVTDASNAQFTLRLASPPAGKYYHFRWSARDHLDNAYFMRSVDDDTVVQQYGNCQHAYINTQDLECY